jgi:hypothetical protein
VDATSHSVSDTLIGSLGRNVIIVGALILIAWKTGERPSWRWGGKEIFKK